MWTKCGDVVSRSITSTLNESLLYMTLLHMRLKHQINYQSLFNIFTGKPWHH